MLKVVSLTINMLMKVPVISPGMILNLPVTWLTKSRSFWTTNFSPNLPSNSWIVLATKCSTIRATKLHLFWTTKQFKILSPYKSNLTDTDRSSAQSSGSRKILRPPLDNQKARSEAVQNNPDLATNLANQTHGKKRNLDGKTTKQSGYRTPKTDWRKYEKNRERSGARGRWDCRPLNSILNKVEHYMIDAKLTKQDWFERASMLR